MRVPQVGQIFLLSEAISSHFLALFCQLTAAIIPDGRGIERDCNGPDILGRYGLKIMEEARKICVPAGKKGKFRVFSEGIIIFYG